MEKIILEYFQILIECFRYDVSVFSNGWLYAPFLIPAIFYTMFFMVKWIVLSAPVWLPVSIVFRSFSYFISSFNRNGKGSKDRLDE